MSLQIPFGIKPVNPLANVDVRYGPHATLQDALDVTVGTREIGLTVLIVNVEYWFKDNITDAGLIEKLVDSYTKNESDNFLNNKVDKEVGKSLIANTEISRLSTMTAIFTTALKTAYDSTVTWISTNGANVLSHLSSNSNPHSVTKAQVNLGSADNTSDENKPVSIATEAALALKKNKNESYNVIDENGNDQTPQDLDTTYPVANNPLGIFRYTDEGAGSQFLYFRKAEGEWINFPSNEVIDTLYARKVGDANQIFEVKDGVNANDSINKSQLDLKQDEITLDDSFYFDNEILRPNLSTFKQTIEYTSGTQIFTLTFEPTFFVAIFINGIYLDETEYVYTSPDTLEILGTMNSGDTVKVIYDHFLNSPA